MSKLRRKYIIYPGLLILLIPAYFLFAEAYPKTAQRFPFMLILLGVDFYLWHSIRDKVKNLVLPVRLTIGILYWIPLAVALFLTIFAPAGDLNLTHPSLVSYILGVVLVIYLAKLITVVFFLLADLYRIILFTIRHAHAKSTGKPVEQGTKITRGRFLRTIGWATGGLFFSGMLIGMVKWAHDFRVRYVDLNLPDLPDAFDGMRIVQISDLHLGSWASVDPIETAVEIINDLDADLVLFTGDLVNYSTKEADRFSEVLRKVEAKHGVYAILGNHDYGDYVNWPSENDKKENLTALYRYYENIGWTLLRNENRVIESDGEKLALIGVENWSSSARFPKLGNLSGAIKGTEDIPVKILMSHDPTHWEKEVSSKYPQIDVTLSGHTHGFQFGLELKNFRWSFAQYVYKYWAGLYENNDTANPRYLYVNRGLGMIGYPGRVGILPEITHITLSS